jgi:hypothetical protein
MKRLLFSLAIATASLSTAAYACDCQKKQAACACNGDAQSCMCPGMADQPTAQNQTPPPQKRKARDAKKH